MWSCLEKWIIGIKWWLQSNHWGVLCYHCGEKNLKYLNLVWLTFSRNCSLPQTHISKTNVNAAVQSKTIFRGNMNAVNFTYENKERQICFSHRHMCLSWKPLWKCVVTVYKDEIKCEQERNIRSQMVTWCIWDTCLCQLSIEICLNGLWTESRSTELLQNTDFTDIVT